MLDRRSLLALGSVAAAVSSSPSRAAKSAPGRRPPFLWGTAGAAYQIEGGNYASDVWVMEQLKPSLFKEKSGDAADAYHRFAEDIALAASLGFNTHRLSIEWSRIEPERGQVSQAAIAYYRGVLETVRRHGMTPVVTFNHFTTPRWFAAGGAFDTAEGIAPFVAYCALLARELGDLIGLAATFNEPNLNAQLMWSPAVRRVRPFLDASIRAAAIATASPRWSAPVTADPKITQPIMIEAHERAYDAIKAVNDRFPLGVTLALGDDRAPASGPSGADRKRQEIALPWIAAKGDFIGVQNYTYTEVGPDGDLPPPPGVELTQMGYPFAPESLEAVIRRVAQHTQRPIYVTENGVATEDDTRRVAFIDRAVQGVANCVADGLDVRGYIHWSLLDNWEWFAGYEPKFGLVSVDRQTFKRTVKPSARHLGQRAKAGLPRAAKRA